jgi:hypothetical protein
MIVVLKESYNYPFSNLFLKISGTKSRFTVKKNLKLIMKLHNLSEYYSSVITAESSHRRSIE